MAESGVTDMEGFELGDPALVCRWRLANRKLPLENRHLRALLAREVNGDPVQTELVAWAKQHIEWTLDQGSASHPNGTLALIVDTQGRAAMAVGPYEALEDTTLAGLTRRAQKALDEGARTHVAPETLWVMQGETLLWDPGEGCVASGASSLVDQLANTLGMDVRVREGLVTGVANGAVKCDEAFLVSDEHGVVPAQDATGPRGQRMASGYQKLLVRN